MNNAARIAGLYLAAPVAAVPAVLATFVAVRHLHAQYEDMPGWLETLNLSLGLVGGGFAYALWLALFRKRSIPIYLLGLPILAWTLVRGIEVRDDALGHFYGIYCCRENRPSLTNVVESAINPLSPWISLSK
jgi:hypothetical protein